MTSIFQQGATEEKAENARLTNIVGAIAVGDLVKSTLGPKGMDKILQSMSGNGDMLVTNDGATILKSIALDNAAAKVLVNLSKVQDDEVGDGTTSVTVLAAELLREAEKLLTISRLHPQVVVEGYRMAAAEARKMLETQLSRDNSRDSEQYKKDLLNIARTTLSSKIVSSSRDYFAQMCVDAVLRLNGTTGLESIQIIKQLGGKLSDSYMDDGFILNKRVGVNQPKHIEKAKILVANTAMDTDKIKVYGAKIKVNDPKKLAELERAERDKMRAKVEKIAALGINVFINRQLIYNWPEQLFADKGIMAIEHADFEGIERLSLVTGGEIASTFDDPSLVVLGECDLVHEVDVGSEKMLRFAGLRRLSHNASSIVLRGATHQILDEAERSIHDALAVLSQTVASDPRIVYGGGFSEVAMSIAVDRLAATVPDKRALAIEAFATALRQLPAILCDNAGLDSADLVMKLRAAHESILSSSTLTTNNYLDYFPALDLQNGCIVNAAELGITESFKLKKQVVLSASEAAEMILRVDDIIRAAPRQRRDY